LKHSSIVVGANNDNTSGKCWAAIEQRGARRDTGGHVESEEAFATAMVAVQEGQASKGKAFLPEPANGLGLDRGAAGLGGGQRSDGFVASEIAP
jgi:hypothetical protein